MDRKIEAMEDSRKEMMRGATRNRDIDFFFF